MRIERTKNATRNIVFGSFMKAYQMIIPFLMRTAMIYFMGVQYLGLNSLFVSILQVLNLAELGVGNAMVFSMYKPIVEDDEMTICSLMRLYRTYYRIIGSIIAVVGIAVTPFIPKLIKGDIPAELNIYILYLLNLAATVLSYWLFAYKNSLLQAHQRTDVSSIITVITNTLQYGLQLLIILFFKNYYLYIIVVLATQIFNNILTAIIVTRMYPKYKPVGRLEKKEIKKINSRIKDMFTGKIGSIILNSADTIVISSFLGLTTLAVYQNYYFIITSIIGFIEIIITSIMAGLGNSFITDTKEKVYTDLKKFTFMYQWLIGICSCCLLCLYQPFMHIWVGEKLMLSFPAVICFSVYFYVYEFNRLLNVYKDAAGLWHEDRFRPLATSLANLALNLVLVQFWGVYGVLLSTVISMLIVGMPWLFFNMFTVFFDKNLAKPYLRQIFYYVIISFVACSISYRICLLLPVNEWMAIFVRLIICMIIPNGIFLLVYHKKIEFGQSVQMLDKITKGKFHLGSLLKS